MRTKHELMSSLAVSSPLETLVSAAPAKVVRAPIPVGSIHLFHRGRVHEATGSALLSLALILGASADKSIFLTGLKQSVCSLRALEISRFFDPNRLIRLETLSRKETLWAGEEALRCKGAGLVILQMRTGPDLFESRRLQIAAQAGGGLGLVLISGRAQSSAAQTRWHCTPHPHLSGAWLWKLTKNKSGQLGLWSVRWKNQETGSDARLRPADLISRDLTRAQSSLGQRSESPLLPKGCAETTPCAARPAAAAGSLAPA